MTGPIQGIILNDWFVVFSQRTSRTSLLRVLVLPPNQPLKLAKNCETFGICDKLHFLLRQLIDAK